MATTSYGVNHPLAVKLWAKKLFHEALKETSFAQFLGEGSDSLIQKRTELSKSAGDQITIGLRMQLSGQGIAGDSTLEGNEEALTTYNDAMTINQLRHAVRSAGKMSEQRVTFDVRNEAKMGLVDWWKDRLDTAFFNQLAGYTGQADTRYTGNQAALAPTSARLLVASTAATKPAAETSLSETTTMYLRLADIDRAVATAKTASPVIRPLKIGGKEMYACFLHPYQVYQLRADASTTGNWFDLQRQGLSGPKWADNPIFTGALGIYNQTILYESTRVPNTVTADATQADQTVFRRAIFCGAQAGAIAFGQDGKETEATWVEEKFDYGNQLGVSGGMIFGLKKMVFNSQDFSTITISSYAPTP